MYVLYSTLLYSTTPDGLVEQHSMIPTYYVCIYISADTGGISIYTMHEVGMPLIHVPAPRVL